MFALVTIGRNNYFGLGFWSFENHSIREEMPMAMSKKMSLQNFTLCNMDEEFDNLMRG